MDKFIQSQIPEIIAQVLDEHPGTVVDAQGMTQEIRAPKPDIYHATILLATAEGNISLCQWFDPQTGLPTIQTETPVVMNARGYFVPVKL